MFTINNPRKENGDLGNEKCDFCGCTSGAYIVLNTTLSDARLAELWCYDYNKKACKGCLLDWIKRIDTTILWDVVEKEKRRNKNV